MKIEINEVKLTGYIQKVCDDAISAANANATLEHWHMIVGKDLIVDFRFTKKPSRKIESDDIMRRVMFRLGNNVPKRFGLNVCGPRCYQYYADGVSSKYSFFPNGEFNYEYALAEVHPFGEDLVLCHEYGDPVYPMDMDAPVKDLDQIPSALLRKNGLNTYDNYSFTSFYAAYIKAFSVDPLEVWIASMEGKNVAEMNSATVIEAQANEDMVNYGCKYYSVCKNACKSCHRDGVCKHEKPVPMKDGLVLSRWREFKQEFLTAKMDK